MKTKEPEQVTGRGLDRCHERCVEPTMGVASAGGTSGMEYLVNMTTRVPDGTPDDAVVAMRAREAARSRQLGSDRRLLRLWRPPLQPGEWRSLGLFSADDNAELEEVLASMPLRVWRKDEVTPLSSHPNDPGAPLRSPTDASTMTSEFLTTFTIAVPAGLPASRLQDVEARETERAGQLAEQGRLLRLWRLPGDGRSLGLWRASGMSEMDQILASLPLAPWMTVDTLALSRHPNDPSP
jgi:muconolactone delta-isomerase